MVASDQRHLLLALLAFQNDFISQPQLLASFGTWLADKSQGIDRYLVDERALPSDELSRLNHMVDLHLNASAAMRRNRWLTSAAVARSERR